MNYPRLHNPGFLVLGMAAGAATALAQGCAGSSPPGSSQLSSDTGGFNVGPDSTTGGDNGSNSTASGGGASTSTECPAGNERCACYGNDTCNSGLACVSQRCVNISGLVSTGGAAASGSGGASASGGSTNIGMTATGGSQND